jgi:hypothetical protein
MKIDLRDERKNASDSIRVKCESDSNQTDESDSHYAKPFDPRL